jgi:hypothetical protein
MPETESVTILADLQEIKRARKSETNTYSLTSGPRSPTKIEYSGQRLSLYLLVDVYKRRGHRSWGLWIGFWPSISESTTEGPVKLDGTWGVWKDWTIKRKCFCRGGRRRKVNKAVAIFVPIWVSQIIWRALSWYLPTNHRYINRLASPEPKWANEILIKPRVESTHPTDDLISSY